MFMFLALVGAFLVLEVLRPKQRMEDARPPGLGDFNFPTATEGRAIPIIWGTVRVDAPNVVWYGNVRSVAKTQEVRTGLFSSDDVVVGFSFYAGMQMALCLGPVDELVAIWVEDKKLSTAGVVGSGAANVNEPNLMGGEDEGGGFVGSGNFYAGNLTDPVNTYLENHITDPVPAYRGTCYYVWEGGYVGTSKNIPAWAFELKRIPDGLDMATVDPGAEALNGGLDANPMNVLYEVLTNTDWGLSISPSLIDVAGFRTAASVLSDEGNGFSMVLDSEMGAANFVEELERQMDGKLYFNRSEGLWKFSLARDDYNPVDLDTYDESNILEVVNYSRALWEETTNEVRLQFLDRSEEYQERYAFAQDMANNIIQGSVVATTVNFPGVKVAALANSLCWRTQRSLGYPLAKLQIKVNRSAFDKNQGDVFKFNSTRLGITGVVFRISKLDYGDLSDSTITIWAVQDIFSVGVGVFSDPSPSGWEEPLDDYALVTAVDSLILEAPGQLVAQDPFNSKLLTRLWQGARHPGGNVSRLHSYLRSGSSRPLTGDYVDDSYINTFLLVGTLRTAVPDYYATAARPAVQYIEVDGLDDLSGLLLVGNADTVTSLLTICYVGGEYIGYEQVLDAGSYYQLYRIYRGLFHTAPRSHDVGERVWFLGQSGGGLTRTALDASHDEVDTQLRSVNRGQESTLAETVVNQVSLAFVAKAPLAPRDPQLNGSYAPATSSLDTQYTSETGLTGDDACALAVVLTPRSWRVTDVTQDHDLGQSSPYAYLDDSPEFDFVLTLDPSGTPATLPTVTAVDTPVAYLLRNEMIKAMGANTPMAVDALLSVTARHTPAEGSTSYENPVAMEFPFEVTSSLQGQDLVHGGLTVNVASTAVVYGETGTYTFDIHTALPSSGILEINLNGGGWNTVVLAAASSGTYSITAGDSVQLRFTQSPANDQYFDVTGPTSEVGYGVLEA